jgi:hypothetical protein
MIFIPKIYILFIYQILMPPDRLSTYPLIPKVFFITLSLNQVPILIKFCYYLQFLLVSFFLHQ